MKVRWTRLAPLETDIARYHALVVVTIPKKFLLYPKFLPLLARTGKAYFFCLASEIMIFRKGNLKGLC
jgi:hypothetical protein